MPRRESGHAEAQRGDVIDGMSVKCRARIDAAMRAGRLRTLHG